MAFSRCKAFDLGYEHSWMAALLKTAAWICLALVVFVTISPIGLRPRDVLPVDLDRALAFCIMAGLFSLAYPRRWLSILVLTVLGAMLIEALQTLSSTRHAHLADAMVKAGGAVVGVLLAKSFMQFLPRQHAEDARRGSHDEGAEFQDESVGHDGRP
jgi:glucose-6-phosphate-specific signal transduction histidine kinase